MLDVKTDIQIQSSNLELHIMYLNSWMGDIVSII
jgi:hypothetical protein